ncbi:MAG: cytochrome c oxidase subunit II [Ignavibacteriae bacterium]|nr:cytochrome c oxidase subunit II [Ignavibacteriota bacterium]MCB9206627.1 cytochrome c oxidase subunit II [Ignavibacteriales bacterium]
MNSNPTSYVQTVDSVMILIFSISLIFLLGVTATMVYFVFKYNRKKGHKPVDIHGSIVLEITWFVIPFILVMAMFYYGFIGYKEFKFVPDDALQIDVTGRMWNWDFVYENGLNLDTLYVPVNKTVKLNMTSADVNHSLYIPAFRIKQDVIAGSSHYLVFKPEQTGNYNIACAEYCGLNHSAMYTKVVVMNENDYEEWYNKNSANENKQTEIVVNN